MYSYMLRVFLQCLKHLSSMSVLYRLGHFPHLIPLYTQTNLSPLYIYTSANLWHIVVFTLAPASHPLKLDWSLQFLAEWLWVAGLTTLCFQNIIYKWQMINADTKCLREWLAYRKCLIQTGQMFSSLQTGSSDFRIVSSPILCEQRASIVGGMRIIPLSEHLLCFSLTIKHFVYLILPTITKWQIPSPRLQVTSLGFREHLSNLAFQRPCLWPCPTSLRTAVGGRCDSGSAVCLVGFRLRWDQWSKNSLGGTAGGFQCFGGALEVLGQCDYRSVYTLWVLSREKKILGGQRETREWWATWGVMLAQTG